MEFTLITEHDDSHRITLYPRTWADYKIDRFYGQVLSQEQISRIRVYGDQTPRHELPLWFYAFRFAMSRGHCADESLGHAFMPWDYGLDADCRLLCRMRRDGRVPFESIPQLWQSLETRRQGLVQLWQTWCL